MLRIQEKLSEGLPPPSAKVSTCETPTGTLHSNTVFPDAHGVLALTSFRAPCPERLLPFAHPGLNLASLESRRDMVRSLMVSSFALISGCMCATCVAYASVQRPTSALKYGRHGHPASSQAFFSASATSLP